MSSIRPLEPAARLDLEGYAIVLGAFDERAALELIAAIGRGLESSPRGHHSMRNVAAAVPLVNSLIESERVRCLVEPVLGPGAFAVRSIYFDKLPGANWKVAWHQDLSIAVRERLEVPGFGPWSIKEGVVHVEPRVELLERMLTLRVHLDDCSQDNGPLRVISGSHQLGRLSPPELEQITRRPPAICTMSRGDALLMRPLLVHASSPARQPSHRRVIHIEFAAEELPGGLQWHERLGPHDRAQ